MRELYLIKLDIKNKWLIIFHIQKFYISDWLNKLISYLGYIKP